MERELEIATAYKILEIEKGATEEEIKKAYIKQIKAHPPEIEPDEFIRIRKAYETLKDPVKRAREDLFTFDFLHDEFYLGKNVVNFTQPLEDLDHNINILKNELASSPANFSIKEQLIELLKQRASYYISKKEWDKALSDFEYLLTLKNRDKEIEHDLFYLYALVAFKQAGIGEYDSAISLWEKSLNLRPDSAQILHNLAIANEKIGEKEKALNYWKRTLEAWESQLQLNPADEYLKNCIIELRKYLADRLLLSPKEREKRTSEEAIQEYRKILELDPDNYHARLQIATAYMSEGKWAEAQKELDALSRKYINNVEILNMLGWAYLNDCKFEEAFATWNRVLAIDAKNTVAKENIIRGHLLVGKKLRDQGLLNAALVHFKSVLKYMPNNPDIYLEIGNTYARKGDYKAAIAAWQTVLQIDPKNKIARKAITEARFKEK